MSNVKIIADRDDIFVLTDKIKAKTGISGAVDFDNLVLVVDNINVDLPELTNPADESEVFLDQEYIDVNGAKKTGTFTIDEELNAQDTLISEQDAKIAELTEILANKASGGLTPKLQEKTISPTTSSQSVTADSGYDGLSKVTINAITTATQATPSITVNSSGLITASSSQTEGYVAAGTKSATKQLTTQAAQTITPSTSNKTISSGRYLTGVQTIKGDSNLVAENIKNGISIFGVTGSYEGSGNSSCSETITLTMNITYDWRGKVFYTDDSNTFTTYSFSGNETKIITCLKDSIVVFSGYGFDPDIKSSYNIDYMDDAAAENGMYVYHFTSDTNITIANGEDGDISGDIDEDEIPID